MSPVARVKEKRRKGRKGRKNLLQALEDLNTVQVKQSVYIPVLSHSRVIGLIQIVVLFQRTLVKMSSQRMT